MRHMVWERVGVRVKGCRRVNPGDSDRSSGHFWAAVIDASRTVISKTFQGHRDRSCMYVCVCVGLCKWGKTP